MNAWVSFILNSLIYIYLVYKNLYFGGQNEINESMGQYNKLNQKLGIKELKLSIGSIVKNKLFEIIDKTISKIWLEIQLQSRVATT